MVHGNLIWPCPFPEGKKYLHQNPKAMMGKGITVSKAQVRDAVVLIVGDADDDGSCYITGEG
jgi:hypothetical protein